MVAARILLVDDYKLWRSTVRSILEATRKFWIVGEASDGMEAIEMAATLIPDVVLLDIGLPGGPSGYELAAQLRQLPGLQGVLLVALTGFCRDEDKTRARESGFDRHLSKPADPDELLALLAAGRDKP